MKVEFTSKGWEGLTFWIENDEEIVIKIKNLIKSILREPCKGIGNPEPLKFGLKGFWSRRINIEHRLVYAISGTKGKDQKCTIIQCRFHYD